MGGLAYVQLTHEVTNLPMGVKLKVTGELTLNDSPGIFLNVKSPFSFTSVCRVSEG